MQKRLISKKSILCTVMLSLLFGAGLTTPQQAYAQQTSKSKFDQTLELARQGNADAQFNLGQMYAEGIRVGNDEREAVNWYRKAATQGNMKAQFNLGVYVR